MPTNAFFTIGQMADQYGVSYRALRLYEEKELLSPLRIGSTRYYSISDQTRLELILKGKKLGFSLNEIWRLLSANSTQRGSRSITATLSREEIFNQIQALSEKRETINQALTELKAALEKENY